MTTTKIIELALAYAVSIGAVWCIAIALRPILDDLADWFMEQEEREGDL